MMSLKTVQTPKKILVIDDEPDVLELTVKVLSDAGYAVTGANGHVEFTSAFKEFPLPDLIVMDVRMPEHDGFWIAERVKSEYDIPIIFVTGHHRPKYQLYAPSAGAASYINKPFEPELLLNEVKKALDGDRRRSGEESAQTSIRSRPPTALGAALTNE